MRFAEVVNSFVAAGDMVWVQDYHCKLKSFRDLDRRLQFA